MTLIMGRSALAYSDPTSRNTVLPARVRRALTIWVGLTGIPIAHLNHWVNHEGVPEQVHVLTRVPHAVGPTQVQGVFEAPIDGLGVATPAVDRLEVGIGRR